MDLLPPVTWVPGSKSTYTRVRISGASSVLYRDRTRHRRGAAGCAAPVRPRPPLAFSGVEQSQLLGVLDSERFADMAPASIFATLLDEGLYHGSIRTMYRLLALHREVGERRRQRQHPVYVKPELLATAPNMVGLGTSRS